MGSAFFFPGRQSGTELRMTKVGVLARTCSLLLLVLSGTAQGGTPPSEQLPDAPAHSKRMEVLYNAVSALAESAEDSEGSSVTWPPEQAQGKRLRFGLFTGVNLECRSAHQVQ